MSLQQVYSSEMKQGMIRVPFNGKGVPRYSDRFKDVLERVTQKEQIPIPKKIEPFFYRIRSIGVGAFSFVYLVAQDNSGTIFAQKTINKKSILPDLLTQIKIHLQLNHCNIVSLHHVYSVQGYIHLIMDYAGESLFVLQKKGKLQTRDNERLTVSILSQLVSAVQYLHHLGIVHADIKLENILYFDGVVKLCDFGYAHSSLHLPAQNEHKQIVGTLQYLDPEYVQGKHSEFSRDIWALGIVAYELITGKNPLQGMTQTQKWSWMLKAKNVETSNLNISKQFYDFLQVTLCQIENRASIDDIRHMEIFEHYEDKLLEKITSIQFPQDTQLI